MTQTPTSMSSFKLALEGVKVLDLTQIMAGPYCTMMLADMGADVVKVEKPNGGDDTRRMGPPFIEGESAAFLGINRNKRSIVIDLRSDPGRELAQRMARESDVLVQNFRPGSLDRMGLGYEQVREINPAIVYCTISGFGATGPYAQRGGFDLVTQGMSGLMSVTGHAGGPPAKVGVPVCDLNAGMFGAIGILTAYINRLKTGQGQHVDTSLLEGGIAYTFWESAMFFATGDVPEPKGSAHRLTAPYQAFETSDGYVNIGAANQANWERLCAAIGRDELVTDPRFVEPRDRMDNLDELVSTLEQTFAQHSSDHWLNTTGGGGRTRRPDQRPGPGVRRSAGAGAGDDGRDRPPRGRPRQEHRHTDQALRDARTVPASGSHPRPAHQRGADRTRLLPR